MNADTLASAFDQWCQSRPLTEHTLRAYWREGGRLHRWWSAPGAQRRFDETTAAALCDALSSDNEVVLDSLSITRLLQTSLLLQAKRVLGAFFLWLAQQSREALALAMHLKHWRPDAPVTEAAHVAASASVEGAAVLLAHAPGTLDSPRHLRDQCIRQLAFRSNASRGELSALRLNDLRVRRDQLQVRLPDRDGCRTTWTVLPHLCLNWSLTYRRSLPAAQRGSSLALRSLSRPMAGLTDAAISRIVAGAKAADPDTGMGTTLRSLRREFVALGYRSGLRESAVARHMRLARAPIELVRPSVMPAVTIAVLVDQLMRGAQTRERETCGGKVRSQ